MLGGAAATLILGIAACGSTVAGAGTAGGGGTPAAGPAATPTPTGVNPGGVMIPAASRHVALCRAIPELTRMTYVLSSRPLSAHLREALPAGATLKDAATVRRMAMLLCALPAVPGSPMMCPNMIGGSYRLFFAAQRRDFPPAEIQLSGCRTVTGLGPARSWSASGSLEQALTQHFGIHFPLTP